MGSTCTSINFSSWFPIAYCWGIVCLSCECESWKNFRSSPFRAAGFNPVSLGAGFRLTPAASGAPARTPTSPFSQRILSSVSPLPVNMTALSSSLHVTPSSITFRRDPEHIAPSELSHSQLKSNLYRMRSLLLLVFSPVLVMVWPQTLELVPIHLLRFSHFWILSLF